MTVAMVSVQLDPAANLRFPVISPSDSLIVSVSGANSSAVTLSETGAAPSTCGEGAPDSVRVYICAETPLNVTVPVESVTAGGPNPTALTVTPATGEGGNAEVTVTVSVRGTSAAPADVSDWPVVRTSTTC